MKLESQGEICIYSRVMLFWAKVKGHTEMRKVLQTVDYRMHADIEDRKKKMLMDKEKIVGTVTGCYRTLDGKIITNISY